MVFFVTGGVPATKRINNGLMKKYVKKMNGVLQV